jgi:AraC-like DNA-binding protein
MNTKLNYIQHWPELAKQGNWSASKLAKLCGVSVRTLERFFLTEIGKRPKAWLSKQRQQQAIELLRDGFTIKETAGYLGYKNQHHFSREFKKENGCPPSQMMISEKFAVNKQNLSRIDTNRRV